MTSTAAAFDDVVNKKRPDIVALDLSKLEHLRSASVFVAVQGRQEALIDDVVGTEQHEIELQGIEFGVGFVVDDDVDPATRVIVSSLFSSTEIGVLSPDWALAAVTKPSASTS